jgi:polyhydroxyalkanoate synthesis regulator protein
VNKLQILKYQNRKLYVQQWSRYATQNELFEHIKDGGEIVVTDYKTGEDITKNIKRNMLTKCNFDSSMLTELIRKSC